MKAIIYPRVSSLDQVDGTSLSTQEKECRRWCAERGTEIVAAYIEAGESAKTADRTQLLAALDFIEERKDIDFFVVHKIDRFARQSRDFFNIKARLAAAGCRMVSVSEPLEDSPSGRFMESVLAAQAQFDNEVRADRCRTGMVESVKRGAWVWAPPLGFKIAKLPDRTATLIHDPVTAPLILKIFELFASGTSQSTLIGLTASWGLCGRTGKPLTKQSISKMLRHVVYAARLQTRLVKGEQFGNWQPIVPPELFDRVQAMLDGSIQAGRSHTTKRPEFILKGLILCASCGRKLTASWSKGRRGQQYPYYHCPHCANGQRLRLEDMHDEFTALLDRIVIRPEHIAMLRKTVTNHIKGAAQAAGAERKARLATISRLNQEEQRILTLLLAGTIDDATYQGRLADIRSQRAKIDYQVEKNNFEFVDYEATWEYTQRILLEPAYYWRNAKDENKLALQGMWFAGGVLFDRSLGVGTRLKPATAKGYPLAVADGITLVEPMRPTCEYWIEFLHFCEKLRLNVA